MITHFFSKVVGVTQNNADGTWRQMVLGTCQPGEPLRAGDGGPGVLGQPPVGLDQASLGVGPLLDGRGQPLAGCR